MEAPSRRSWFSDVIQAACLEEDLHSDRNRLLNATQHLWTSSLRQNLNEARNFSCEVGNAL